MKAPDDIAERADTYYLHTHTVERTAGWYLWKDHMFLWERERYESWTDNGVSVEVWLSRWRDRDDARVREIIADLETRGY